MSGPGPREDKELRAGRGAVCKGPGLVVPVVDRARCEGKRDCVDACPHDVFEVRRIDDGDFQALGFFARLKSRAHGRMSAYTPRQTACEACGDCVRACPEKAIRLVAVGRAANESPGEGASVIA